MREVTVRCRWESVHTIEVPDETPRLEPHDLQMLIDVSGDDVESHLAELVDWDIKDRGPVTE